MNLFKKTKIVATIGPATDTQDIIYQLAYEGMNAARFNFSHGTHEEHERRIKNLRSVEKKLSKPIAFIADLQGPKIRLGKLSKEPQKLTKGQEVILFHADEQTDEALPVPMNIFPHLKINDRIFINDGIITLNVLEIENNSVMCEVIAGGEIRSHKGMNLPDTYIPNVVLTEKDKEDLVFSLQFDPDYIAISFVQNEHDVTYVRKFLTKYRKTPKIIVKLETSAAMKNLEDIVKETDAIMIARGDLAAEIGQEEVPIMQREIITMCRKYKKPVIVATQMLESMITNTEPTRAEVNDVATAVLDQVDAVMLSAETAHGAHPIETVKMMEKIIKRVETYYYETHSERASYTIPDDQDQTTAIAAASSLLAQQLGAKIVFALTASGRTAEEIASYRPVAPIIALTDNEVVYKQLTLVWGIKSFYRETITNNDEAYQEVVDDLEARNYLEKGDKVVLVTGAHPGKAGNTNGVRVTII